MTHPFHKRGFNPSNLPSRITDNMWERLKKKAHHIWEIGAENGTPVAVRKRQETAQLDPDARAASPRRHEVIEDGHNAINPGDFVLLFMGGKKITAKVLGNSDGMLDLTTNDGYINGVPAEWVRKTAAPPPPPAAPAVVQQPQRQNKPSQRAITRDDIPVQNKNNHQPNQQQAPQYQQPVRQQNQQNQYGELANKIMGMLQQGGGRTQIRINPTTYIDLAYAGNGEAINASVFQVSTERIHGGQYQNLNDFLAQMGQTIDIDNVQPMGYDPTLKQPEKKPERTKPSKR